MANESNSKKKPCENNMASENQTHVQPDVGSNETNSVETGIETVRSSSDSILEGLSQLATTHHATGSLLDTLGNVLETTRNTMKTNEFPQNIMEEIFHSVVDLKFKPLKDVLSVLVCHQHNFRKHLENMHVIQINNQHHLESIAQKTKDVNPGLQVFQAQLQYVNHVNAVFREVARLANEASAKKQAEMMEELKNSCFQGEDGEIYAIQKVDPRLVQALEDTYGEIVVDDSLDFQITVPHPVDPIQINFADFQVNNLLGNLPGSLPAPFYVKQDFTPKMLSRRSKNNLANQTRPVSIRNRTAPPAQHNAEPLVEQHDSLPGLPGHQQ